MKCVFTANTMSGDQEIVKSLLEKEGIPCIIRNEHLAMALGELAPSECAPELWILSDTDFAKAKEIVEAWRNTEVENHGTWVCLCGETIEGQFSSCWQCERERQIDP